jgi:hypothetical protein
MNQNIDPDLVQNQSLGTEAESWFKTSYCSPKKERVILQNKELGEFCHNIKPASLGIKLGLEIQSVLVKNQGFLGSESFIKEPGSLGD